MGNFSYRHPLKSLIFNMLSLTIDRNGDRFRKEEGTHVS